MDFVQKSRNYRDLRVLTDEQMGGLSRDKSSRVQLEHDKRARREIANSNERRRMQSINSGFQRIKSLLPRCKEEKMSKSAILHQAVDYIGRLEQEKQFISRQNEELVRMLQTFKSKSLSVPPTKRRKDDTDDVADLSLVMPSPDSSNDCGQNDTAVVLSQLQNLIFSLKAQLRSERECREAAEKQVDGLKNCLKMECLVEESVEEQVVTSDCPELPSVITLPMLVAEHETSLADESVELHDRSTVARRNLETIVKAIHHVEGGDRLSESAQEIPPTIVAAAHDQMEKTLRFCIPSSLSCQPLASVLDDGRSSESGSRIPMTLNALSILLSPHRSPNDPVIFQPVLTQRLS